MCDVGTIGEIHLHSIAEYVAILVGEDVIDSCLDIDGDEVIRGADVGWVLDITEVEAQLLASLRQCSAISAGDTGIAVTDSVAKES